LLATSATVNAQVGIGTNAPSSTLDVRGSLSTSFRSFNTSTALNDTDYAVAYTGTTNATITLPAPATCPGRMYVVKNASAGLATPQLTLSAPAPATIDGAASWVADEPAEVVAVVSNGTNWVVSYQSVPVSKTSTTGSSWLAGGNVTNTVKALGTLGNIDLPFITNGTEQIRLTAGGNLGMGTTNPTHKFEIIGGTDPLLLDGVQTGMATDSLLTIENGVVKKIAQTAMPAAPTNIWSTLGNAGVTPAANFLGTTDNSSIRIRTNNTQRIIVDSTGNVGIGTATPSTRLEVNSGVAGTSGLTLTQMPEGAILYTNTNGEVVYNASTLSLDVANTRLGIASSSPNSTLTVGGSVSMPVVTRSANYTVTAGDYTVLCNSTTGAFTVTLPAASSAPGRMYVIKKTSAEGNLITVHATGADYIDGAANQYLYSPYSYITVQSDGLSSWSIIGQH